MSFQQVQLKKKPYFQKRGSPTKRVSPTKHFVGQEQQDEPPKIVKQPLLNLRNRRISKKQVLDIFKKVDIELNDDIDMDLWQKVFIHKSYAENRKKKNQYEVLYDSDSDTDYSDALPLFEDSYERLEFMGDAVLQSVAGVYLFDRFPTQDQGFLTKIRSKMVKTESLCKFAFYLGLQNHLIMSKFFEEKSNGRNNPFVLEDCFEALIGALYLQTRETEGYSLVRKFIITIFERLVDFPTLIMVNDNYKDQLMWYYQKNFAGAVPTYEEIDVEVTETNRIFTMGVADMNGEIVGTGRGKSKKEAEQLAAKDACIKLGIIPAP